MEKMEKVVSLCKRRGFVYPSSEIYGGLGNVYDYGPLGVELLKNIRELWWKTFVRSREDVVGIESQIFMHPEVWVASGHVGGFADPMIEDMNNKKRHRADHIVEEWSKNKLGQEIDTDLMSVDDLDQFIKDNNVLSPDGNPLGEVKSFNLLFKTQLGAVENDTSDLYLRGETAQGMYVLFKNVLDSTRVQVPFGIAQHGKVFRNEVTKGKFIFRTLEFEQMEIQYFIKEEDHEEEFEKWRKEQENWYFNILGIPKENFKWKPHSKLIFYAKAAEDLQYKFPWGFDEVTGLHYRTDYDLKTHAKHSGQKLEYRDPHTNEVYVPHVMETTWGLNRNMFMILDHAYTEEGDRTYLKLPNNLAPYKLAIFPLLKNKPELVEKAKELFDKLKLDYHCYWDDRGNIGKRYAYQDEIGTPYCVTIDYDTLETNEVTVRFRDTAEQEKVNLDELEKYLFEKLR